MLHPSNRTALELFLDRLLCHSDLSAAERDSITALPTLQVEVGAHRDIVRLGEIVEHSCLVDSGLVGRFGLTGTGARQFVSVHVPGDMVDLLSLMVPQASLAINALTRSTILKVPHSALREVADFYPAVAAAFWRDCVVQAAIVAQWLINVGRHDARSRLAHLFCEMALRSRAFDGSVSRTFELPMTQDQLADALGLTPVHVNRTLTALRDEGLLAVSRGSVEILDWDGLRTTADFDPAYLQLKNGRLKPE